MAIRELASRSRLRHPRARLRSDPPGRKFLTWGRQPARSIAIRIGKCMASVNKVILLGNLGRDPETRYTTGGDAVTNLNIATSEQWKDKSGEKQERTEWHTVVLFGRQAEVAGEYLKKGRSVYIEGRLQTRKWQDKDGQDRYSTEIVADRMQLIGSARDAGGGDVELGSAPSR